MLLNAKIMIASVVLRKKLKFLFIYHNFDLALASPEYFSSCYCKILDL